MNKVFPLAIAIMLGLALARECAHAGGDPGACEALADYVGAVGRLRDRGVSSEAVRARADSIADPEVKLRAEMVITAVFGQPKMTPDQMAEMTLEACLN